MAAGWSKWHPLEDRYFEHYQHFGIYQVRIVDSEGQPIRIPRIGRDDVRGIIYIGRSGYSIARTKRTISIRLREFLRGSHSGGENFEYMEPQLRRCLGLFYTEYRSMELHDQDVKSAEKRQLEQYRDIYCELPPYNGSIPRTG